MIGPETTIIEIWRDSVRMTQFSGETMEDYMTVLRREHDAEDGSFLLGLRCHAEWDKDVFSRLALAMEECARAYEGRDMIERWIANIFWYLDWNVAEWARHVDPRHPEDHEYHQEASRRVGDLAYWLFFGMSPFERGDPLPPI